MSKLQMRVLSSLEKCFLDEQIENKPEKKSFIMLRNERLSFQVAYRNEQVEKIAYAKVTTGGSLAAYATVREVVCVPVAFPVTADCYDEDYLRTEPGLYPDLLRPLHYVSQVPLPYGQLHALWVDIRLPEGFAGGEYTFSVSLWSKDDELLGQAEAQICVIEAELPKQKLIRTEWFYTDCLAEHYHVRAFSEKHWKIIESFLRTAVQNGINMILTPVFTPELDTYVGGERMTTQLLDITVEQAGVYSFGTDKLERWIDLCLACGVEYFEIPHFFTQWGAQHAPKFVAKVNGRIKRIFGWETDALGEEYMTFLGQLIPTILAVFKQRGLDSRLFFHVSDEPNMKSLEHYSRCRELLSRHLEGYHIIDALSDFAFYESGALKKPVPVIKKIEPFLEHKIPGLWAYYCGASGCVETTNRFISMSQTRVRMLGVQLYLNRIEGFLHWGYNFYHNRYSHNYVDPLGSTDGEYFAPGGDTSIVYPGNDGEAWESMRMNALREAMDDMRALDLCESIHGREFTEKLILQGTDGTLTFKHYPKDAEYLISLRERIAEAVR